MYCPGLLKYIRLVWPPTRDVGRCPQGSPELWPRLEGEEVKGLTSLAVAVDWTGTVSVAPVKAPPVLCVQKPPRWVGKRFRDRLVAAPEGKVEKPAGLKTRPARLRQNRLGANPAVCRGDVGCQAWRPQLCKPWGSWRRWPRLGTRFGWWRSGVHGAGRCRGHRRAAEGVGWRHPDGPRWGGRRGGRLAARPAAGC